MLGPSTESERPMPSTTIRTTARFNVTKITPGICAFSEQNENELRNALRHHKSLSRLNVTVEFTHGTAYRASKSGAIQIDKVVCHVTLDGKYSIQEIQNLLLPAAPRHVVFDTITTRTI